jgi:hypothetical protein
MDFALCRDVAKIKNGRKYSEDGVKSSNNSKNNGNPKNASQEKWEKHSRIKEENKTIKRE